MYISADLDSSIPKTFSTYSDYFLNFFFRKYFEYSTILNIFFKNILNTVFRSTF